MERMAEIDTAVFDKTGTLTLGQPWLINAQEIEPHYLEIAAELSLYSRHPLSRALALFSGATPMTPSRASRKCRARASKPNWTAPSIASASRNGHAAKPKPPSHPAPKPVFPSMAGSFRSSVSRIARVKTPPMQLRR